VTKRKLGGYAFNYEITRARQACRGIRRSLKRIIDEKPGPQASAVLLTRAALSLGDIEEAIAELERIGKHE